TWMSASSGPPTTATAAAVKVSGVAGQTPASQPATAAAPKRGLTNAASRASEREVMALYASARSRRGLTGVRTRSCDHPRHGVGLLNRPGVRGAARLDARLRARRDLADRDRLRRARGGRLPARDRAAAAAREG